MATERRPEWWDWDLELSPHLLIRSGQRHFDEFDLRTMIEEAVSMEPGSLPDRWRIDTKWRRRPWSIVVDVDEYRKRVTVVTAFPVES